MTRIVKLTPYGIKPAVIAKLISSSGALLRIANYKGYWHIARAIGRYSSPTQLCTIPIGENSWFCTALSDSYWSRLLYPGYAYEFELKQVLILLKKTNFSFFDCGANFGYWSIYCSDDAIGCENVFAIEASPTTFQMLQRNWELNSKRFKILNRAVYQLSGDMVDFECVGENHADAHIAIKSSNTQPVETISIDDLLASDKSGNPALIKLDVEGAEIQSFEGAQKSLSSDCLFAYEDHGNDVTCKVTRWLLNNTDLLIYFIDQSGISRAIKSTSDAARVKKLSNKGYNFFATKKGSTFHHLFSRRANHAVQ